MSIAAVDAVCWIVTGMLERPAVAFVAHPHQELSVGPRPVSTAPASFDQPFAEGVGEVMLGRQVGRLQIVAGAADDDALVVDGADHRAGSSTIGKTVLEIL